MGKSVPETRQYNIVPIHHNSRMKAFSICLCAAVLLVGYTSALGVLPTIVGGSLVLGSIPLSVTILGLQIPTLGLLGVAALTKAAILKAKGAGGLSLGGGGAQRYKRSVNTEESNLIDAIGPMLDVQAQLDKQTGCGMKLICELSAKHQANEELNEEEKLLLVLFGREHGRTHCIETFNKCSWSSDDVAKRF